MSTMVDRLWRLAALPLVFFLAIPVSLLFLRTTPGELWQTLQQPVVVSAILTSLQTTLISLLIILVFGTPLAYWLGRYDFRGKRLLEALIDLPTILPPSVAGVALLITFGRRGPLGFWLEAWGIQVAFTRLAVILAQVFIAAPFYVRAAALGFAAVDLEIIQAAQLDGASRWGVFRTILLPLARQALVSGGMMSWARSLGEFGATILFAGNFPGRTQTMPTAIYLGFEVDINIALTLSVILVLISFAAILLVRSLVSGPARENQET